MTTNIEITGNVLSVKGLTELGKGNYEQVEHEIDSVLGENITVTVVEVDLSGAVLIDSFGLGALIRLLKTIQRRNGVIRLLYPNEEVSRILELTRMHKIFEIVRE